MKCQRFLFVYPDINKFNTAFADNKGAYYYGIAQLSSVLKQNGIEVGLLQYTDEPTKEEFLKSVKDFKPDIIGFSSTTMMIAFCYLWAGWLKEVNISKKLIIGGCHASESPDDVASTNLFDAIFIGESEDAIVEYCQRVDENPLDIIGTVVKKNERYINNGVRQLEKDLDSYPFPDMDIFDYDNLYDMVTHKRGILTASRGCPYKCSFCSIEKYHDIYKGKGMFVRFKSVDYVIEESKDMIKNYPDMEYFHFVDDVLVTRVDWMEEFAEKFPKEIGMDFYCNVNANSIKTKTIGLLAKAGCRRIQIGVETGNEDRRKNLLKKPVTNKKILEVASECRKYGIVINSLNMIGLPYETEDHILETVKFNAKVRPQLVQCCIFYPFPNTSLYDLCVKDQLIKAYDPFKSSDYFSTSIIKNPHLSDEALYFYRDFFKLLINIYQYVNIDWIIKLVPYKILRKLLNPFKTKNELSKWLFKPRENGRKEKICSSPEQVLVESVN